MRWYTTSTNHFSKPNNWFKYWSNVYNYCSHIVNKMFNKWDNQIFFIASNTALYWSKSLTNVLDIYHNSINTKNITNVFSRSFQNSITFYLIMKNGNDHSFKRVVLFNKIIKLLFNICKKLSFLYMHFNCIKTIKKL